MTGQRGQLGWLGIVRLGLVQTSLGSLVVLMTSTLNRVMVVELALPAVLPGFLVAAHYIVQMSRPRFGHGSDRGQRRTPWIIGGILVLAFGSLLASASVALMATSTTAGIALALTGFLLIGAGAGASGTCLLVLLAATVSKQRRAAAASITWIMMIAGFAVTAGIVGALLDPFSFQRLVVLTAATAVIAITVTSLALHGIENRYGKTAAASEASGDDPGFLSALREVFAERQTRRFALFVFISMLAYSAQDLVLEPFAGMVFHFTPGDSTQLGGTQHAGVLLGMILVAIIGYRFGPRRNDVLRVCMMVGCLSSALLLLAIAMSGFAVQHWPLHATVFALGIANGVFAVAAIGSMMGMVSEGREHRAGIRMGVWGAAQALAFASGGIAGTLAVDVVRALTNSPLYAYSLVFVLQATLFAIAAYLAAAITRRQHGKASVHGELEHAY